MLTKSELDEYLAEIRSHVCAQCVEREPNCPPCAPAEKRCGVEQHLSELIDVVHSVHSEWIAPYREASLQICERCSFRHSSVCPCPVDYLHVLIVQAVEAVDARHELRAIGMQRLAGLDDRMPADADMIRRIYEESVGEWTGCDWPTRIGKTGLDLNGWTAFRACEKLFSARGSAEEADWQSAADWLAHVETVSQQAEQHAALAVRAAARDHWLEALEHARAALASEFATGRAVRRGLPMTWHPLFLTVEAAVCEHLHPAQTAPGVALR